MQFSRFHNIIKSNERIPKFLIMTKISLSTLHSLMHIKTHFVHLNRICNGTRVARMRTACVIKHGFSVYIFIYFYKTARVENMQHTRKNGKRQKGHGGACIRLQGNQGLQARMQVGWELLLCIHMRHKADKWQQKKLLLFFIFLGYETSDRAYTYIYLHWIYWNYRKYLEIRIYFFHHSKHYYFPHNHQLATQVRTHAHARLFCFIPFYNRNKPFNWRRMCVNNK